MRIGKRLSEDYTVGPLDEGRAIEAMADWLPSQASSLIEVRARGPRMVACLVARASLASVRMCRSIGFDLVKGGTGVFGLAGRDAARVFSALPSHQRAWLEAPSGRRETKVILICGGIALLSLQTLDGKVTITAQSHVDPASE